MRVTKTRNAEIFCGSGANDVLSYLDRSSASFRPGVGDPQVLCLVVREGILGFCQLRQPR